MSRSDIAYFESSRVDWDGEELLWSAVISGQAQENTYEGFRTSVDDSDEEERDWEPSFRVVVIKVPDWL